MEVRMGNENYYQVPHMIKATLDEVYASMKEMSDKASDVIRSEGDGDLPVTDIKDSHCPFFVVLLKQPGPPHQSVLGLLTMPTVGLFLSELKTLNQVHHKEWHFRKSLLWSVNRRSL